MAAIAQFFAGDPDVPALIAALAPQYLGGTGRPGCGDCRTSIPAFRSLSHCEPGNEFRIDRPAVR
jgi:hypothetical protein